MSATVPVPELISQARSALLEEGRQLTEIELRELSLLPESDLPALTALAHEVRLATFGPAVEVESILSAKTGGCSEDCHFCAQSARYESTIQAAPLLDTDEVLQAAEESAGLGASEFCLVLAIRGPDERVVDRLLELTGLIRERVGLNVAVSAGILTVEHARRLADGGVHRYNHNLETARSFFPQVVTSHTWEERRETCRLVKEHGMQLCCGVLLGMGETHEQRLELIGQYREVDPDEIPINFLNPRPGTPLGERPLVEPLEALRWIAMFRLGLPRSVLCFAGGREVTLRDLQAMGMTAGINALIVGNYLTTLGRPPGKDLEMLADLKMPVRGRSPGA